MTTTTAKAWTPISDELDEERLDILGDMDHTNPKLAAEAAQDGEDAS